MCVYLPRFYYIMTELSVHYTEFHYGYTFNISRLRNVNLILLVILVFSQFIVSVKTISIILTGLSFI